MAVYVCRSHHGALRGRDLAGGRLDLPGDVQQVRLLGTGGVDPLVDVHEAADAGDRLSQPGGNLGVRLLEGLHARWSALLSSLTPEQLEKTFLHPESGVQKIDRTLQTYAWHSRHHVAHIRALRERSGWR